MIQHIVLVAPPQINRTSRWSSSSDPVEVLAAAADGSASKDVSLSGFHPGHQHLRLPNVTEGGEKGPPRVRPPTDTRETMSRSFALV